MSFRHSFSERLKILRVIHELSSAELAELLFFQNKGSIGHIESGKALPSSETLDHITDLFAVSLDWLAGKSDIIYRPEIIESIEKELLLLRYVNNAQTTLYRVSSYMVLYDIYADSVQRATTFSLPVRANIVFFLQVLLKSSMLFYTESLTDEDFKKAVRCGIDPLRSIYYPLMVERDGKRRANRRWNLCKSCFFLLQDYIVDRSRSTPFYNVEAAWKGLQGKKE